MSLNRWILVTAGAGLLAAGALAAGFWAGRRSPPVSAPPAIPASRPASSPAGRAKPATPASAPAPGPATVVRNLLAQAEQAVTDGRWLEARTLCQQILQEQPESPEAVQAQQRLGAVNVHLLFSPAADPNAPFFTSYLIQPGDTLGRIARQHRTTVELLQKANHLTGDKILVGRTLKVPKATFSVVVDKSQNLLTVKANHEEVIKTYTVSTGKEDQTPVGTFTIVNKLIDPPWYTSQGVIPPGSPENILGARWLGFSKSGYGIHGTTDPATIGQSVTSGCVRMRNEEVEELYALLPLGTEVTIVD